MARPKPSWRKIKTGKKTKGKTANRGEKQDEGEGTNPKSCHGKRKSRQEERGSGSEPQEAIQKQLMRSKFTTTNRRKRGVVAAVKPWGMRQGV